jgi:hypothetical protein
MTTTLIKIDLDSIKLNPKHGQTQTRIPTNTEITIDVIGSEPFDYLKDRENCYITNQSYNLDYSKKDECQFSALILDPSLVDRLMKEKENGNCKEISITQKYNYQTFDHLPISKYNYSYEIVDLICEECGQTFKSDKLLELDNDDDECFAYTNTGCPHCRAWDCCEVEYEDIDSALFRKEQI